MEGGDSVDGTVAKPPTRAVVEAVAEAEGVPSEELRPPTYEPLHEAIDPDALDALFEDRADGRPRPGGTVTFPYCGYTVTVGADGAVTLEEAPTGRDDVGP